MLQRRRTRRRLQGSLIRLAPSPPPSPNPGPRTARKTPPAPSRRLPERWQPALINGDFIGHNISAANVLLLELLIVLNYSWHFLKMTLRLLQGDALRHDCLVTLSFISCQTHLSLFSLLFFLFSACPLGPEPVPSGSLRTHFHSGPGAEPVSIPVQNHQSGALSADTWVFLKTASGFQNKTPTVF